MKRGRNQRRRQGVNPNRALDSNGPDVRIRGTANQIYDKYVALARDASSSGDRVKAESYQQHAEHYFRLIRSMQQSQPTHNQPQAGVSTEQPSVSDSEPPKEGTRADRQRANGADKKESATLAEDGEKPGAGEGDEERRPRRRRPRRTSKRAETGDEEDAAPKEDKPESEAAAAAE